ncbi:MAG: outer membrane protein assembly factor BamB, partial [Sinobacterium sp.]|nr:outer membrane protein assembly factor BamB [Sinobacterium sp.]
LFKENGKEAWDIELEERLTTGIEVDDKLVYVASRNGVLIALDKFTGEQKWAFTMRSELVSRPVSDNSFVYMHTSNGDVYKINATSGEQVWRIATNLPAVSLRGNASPLLVPQLVIVGTANGKVALINRDTGQVFAEPKVATPDGDTEIERMVDVDGLPKFDNGRLFAASFQGQVVALDMKNGKTLWKNTASSFQDVEIGFDSVYLVTDDSLVNAYNIDTGELKWVQEGLLRRKASPAVAFSSYLIVSDYQGYIHILSQLDGRFIARKKISGSGVRTPALIDGNTFYVIANNGRLKAYQLELD